MRYQYSDRVLQKQPSGGARTAPDKPKPVGISAITQAELYFGALNKAELAKIKRHLSLLFPYPLDASVSDVFLQLMETYALSHKLSIPDALIAATAQVHNLELYTLNLKDFQFIHRLRFYQPVSY